MYRPYNDTVDALIDAFQGLTPELQKAARFFLDHPEDVGLNSMRTVAGQAGVTPATISRLSKALGYDAYEQFREPYRQRLRSTGPGFSEQLEDLQARGARDGGTLIEEVRAQELDNVARTLSNEQIPVLENAADILWSSRRVYVLGLRGAFAPAFLFHYAHQLFRDMCRLLDTQAGVFADQLRGIGKKDSLLVISFPPYTHMTIDVVQYAADAGVQIIAITDSALSPVAKAAKLTIVTRNDSPFFYHSFTGALAVCQALITLLVAKSGRDAVDIVREAEKQLSRISAYW